VAVNYYRILGLQEGASTSRIKVRYQELAKLHHPDKGGDAKAMVRINKAYEVLSNPRLRYKYDQSLHPTGLVKYKGPVSDITVAGRQMSTRAALDEQMRPNVRVPFWWRAGVFGGALIVLALGVSALPFTHQSPKPISVKNVSHVQTANESQQTSGNDNAEIAALKKRLAREEAQAQKDEQLAQQAYENALKYNRHTEHSHNTQEGPPPTTVATVNQAAATAPPAKTNTCDYSTEQQAIAPISQQISAVSSELAQTEQRISQQEKRGSVSSSLLNKETNQSNQLKSLVDQEKSVQAQYGC
jgi:curved DNA-binding protein CbpA